MIAALRIGSFLVNAGVAFGGPLLLGAPAPAAAGIAAACFLASWWGCGRAPRGRDAAAPAHADAAAAARALGAPPPVFVRAVPGWTAAAVRAPGGYGLLLGDEVEAEHRAAILTHEVAHVRGGDLRWEPFTDGPARLVLPLLRRVPPLAVAFFPLYLFGTPLARATELAADRLAAERLSSYPLFLQQVRGRMNGNGTLLYPSLARRLAHVARDSKKGSASE